MFQFLCKLESETYVVSKLSEITKLFDPLESSAASHCYRKTHLARFVASGHPMGRVHSSGYSHSLSRLQNIDECFESTKNSSMR